MQQLGGWLLLSTCYESCNIASIDLPKRTGRKLLPFQRRTFVPGCGPAVHLPSSSPSPWIPCIHHHIPGVAVTWCHMGVTWCHMGVTWCHMGVTWCHMMSWGVTWCHMMSWGSHRYHNIHTLLQDFHRFQNSAIDSTFNVNLWAYISLDAKHCSGIRKSDLSTICTHCSIVFDSRYWRLGPQDP